ncbi:MAG TPA: hypothetical protein PLG47_05900, partial [Candidatus Dojkabacteria bacterium]|nr:hypothetical protein [Candidatus Dojkabacteria bacterium]
EAISIIKEHLAKQYNKKNPNYLFCFLPVTTNFDKVLKLICKKVFKEEQVLIYKNTESLNDYKQYFKWQVISSHAFRRYAIQRNIFHLGLMAATTLSGHTNLNTVRKHYSDWMNQQDLTA